MGSGDGHRGAVAQAVIEKADYILALKGNQGILHGDVALFLAGKAKNFKGTIVSHDTVAEGEYGRIENRTTIVFHQVE